MKGETKMEMLAEILKLNLDATAQCGCTRLNTTDKDMNPWSEGIVIDFHGMPAQKIRLPEGCELNTNDFFEGVDGTFWCSGDQKIMLFAKGIDPKSRVDWTSWERQEHVFAMLPNMG